MFKLIFTLLSIFISSIAYASSPEPWQLYLQKPASPVMHELYDFHYFIMIIISSIVAFVIFLVLYVMFRFNEKVNPVPAKFRFNLVAEVTWTVIPIIILVIIAIPSFRILRMEQYSPPAEMTVKVVGSQWFWTYKYPDNGDFEFDSYMIQDSDLLPNQLRLLEVDNRLVIPKDTVVKFLVTSADVIHSFAIPALGIKIDAVPGRTNETWAKVDKLGVYYGQCSELCGVNHGFMPIAIEVVSKEDFKYWLTQAQDKFAKNAIKNHKHIAYNNVNKYK